MGTGKGDIVCTDIFTHKNAKGTHKEHKTVTSLSLDICVISAINDSEYRNRSS